MIEVIEGRTGVIIGPHAEGESLEEYPLGPYGFINEAGAANAPNASERYLSAFKKKFYTLFENNIPLLVNDETFNGLNEHYARKKGYKSDSIPYIPSLKWWRRQSFQITRGFDRKLAFESDPVIPLAHFLYLIGCDELIFVGVDTSESLAQLCDRLKVGVEYRA